MEARRAHNPEVVGSSPASATKKDSHPSGWLSFLSASVELVLRFPVYETGERSSLGQNTCALPVADAAQAFCVQRSVCNAVALSARRTPGYRKPGQQQEKQKSTRSA